MRSLPRIVSKIPNDLRNFLDRVREYMSEGGEERFVTLRELKVGGIVGTTPAGTIEKPAVYGIEKSKAPTGLTTTGALASVIIEWDEPNYLGHSHAEIWAATTNDFTLKELVGTAEGIVFSHNIGSGATRYYWVRFVNTEQVAGPFNDTVGTVGVTGQNPDYLIEVLSDAYGVAGPAPFFQLDNPTVINGVTIPAGTYIKQAWIADATISRAKIQDLAVDSAKISDLTASKITAGNIQTGYIRSTSYTAGASGWSINADGSASFNGTLTAGGATAYATGTGMFSGFDAGTYKFRVGTAAGNRLYWDGTTLTVTGAISSSSISGGTISGSDVYAGTVRTSNTTTYSSGNGFYLSGTQFRIGDPAGAYMRWTGSALELSTSAANLINTPNITNNAVSQLVSSNSVAGYPTVFSTAGTFYTFPSFTVPAAGLLVITITSVFHNFSTTSNLRIQAMNFVNNASGVLDPPIHFLSFSVANATFIPVGPTPATTGSSATYTSQEIVSVTAGQSISIDVDMYPGANNTTIYLLDSYYTAILYKK